MILYKYASYNDGGKILESSSVLFTQPKFFNAPFDLPSYPEEQQPVDDFPAQRSVVRRYW